MGLAMALNMGILAFLMAVAAFYMAIYYYKKHR